MSKVLNQKISLSCHTIFFKFAKIKFNMMKKFFALLVLLSIVFPIWSQIAPGKYWIQFTDKNGSPYNINNPESFLSERAIQRRLDYNIAIDNYDIPVNSSYIQAVSDKGASIINPSKWLNGVTVEVSDPTIIDEIRSLPFVQNVREFHDDKIKQEVKEKTFFSKEFISASDNSDYRDYYGMAYNQINQLNGIALHETGYMGQGMWIGVCDGGYDNVDEHEVFEDMYNNNRLLGTRDFVRKNGDVYNESSHGTSCLSLMAGNIPDKYVGTAPLASYYLCRTEDVKSENLIEEYNWVSAAEFLDSLGIDIISTSLGYVDFDNPQWDHVYSDLDGETSVITKGSEIACSRGILCVTSAGNEGGTGFPYISVPADGENVLTVGAVDKNGDKASFSSVGPTYDNRIKPDVMAHGYNVTVAVTWGNGYGDGSGTSFSCPVLAGMAACLWQANKQLPASVIRDVLRQNANFSDNPNNNYGYGIPDFKAALEALIIEENNNSVINPLISVFPNPTNGNVKVNIETIGKVNVEVYNQMGKLLYSSVVTRYYITDLTSFLNKLGSGLYLIKVNDDDNNFTAKFVKY